jgi:lysozyme
MRRLLLFASLWAGCGGVEPFGELEEANTQQCPMQVVEGLDVYQGDGTINWTMVKASGRQFAFIKATQGNYNKQTTFGADWSGAAAAGVMRSAYHFFDATVDGKAQAQWFLDEIAANGGMTPGDLPPMLDIECPTSSVQANAQSNCEHTGDSGWAPPATIAQRAFDWLDAVELATGKKAIIYSYPSWFAGAGVTDAKLAKYPLFIATYGSCASVPPPWTSAVFWQYSASGTVPGLAAKADVDRFFGSPDALMGFANPPIDAGADLAVTDAAQTIDASPLPDAADGGPMKSTTEGGCSCRLGADDPPSTLALAFAFALVWLARRRARAG